MVRILYNHKEKKKKKRLSSENSSSDCKQTERVALRDASKECSTSWSGYRLHRYVHWKLTELYTCDLCTLCTYVLPQKKKPT